MATKAIFETEINDDAFKRFQANVAKFQEKLKSLPGAWGKIDAGVESTASHFADMTAALLAQTATLHEMAAAERKLDKAEREAARAKKDELDKQKKQQKELLDLEKKRKAETMAMWSNVASIGKGVAGITVDMLKWVGIGGILSGLAGAGGLWGLDSLANSVGNSRRTAMGIGVSTGDLQAAKLTFSRYGDAQSILDNIANAQARNEHWSELTRAGGSINGDVADSFLNILQKGRRVMQDKSRPQGVTASIYGLDQFAPLEFWRAISKETNADFKKVLDEYKKNQAEFDLDKNVTQKWQDFSVKMGHAGRVIENAFIDSLEQAKLPEMFGKLSDSLAATIKTFMQSPQLHVWLTEFGDGIEGVAKYMATDKFQKDVSTFVTDVGILAHKLVDALVWLKLIPNPNTDTGEPDAYKNPRHHGPVSLNPWDPRNYPSQYRDVTVQDIRDRLKPGAKGPATPMNAADLALRDPIDIESNSKSAGNFFARTWGTAGAAAIVASLNAESSDTAHGSPGDNGTAFGAAQWHAPRIALFNKWAAEAHRADFAHSSLGEQWDFINYDLQHHYKAVGDQLRKMTDPREAARLFSEQYEGASGASGNPRVEAERRANAAAAITVLIQNQTGAHVSVQASQLPH